MKLYLESLVELTRRDGVRNHLGDLTVADCEYLYSKGIKVERLRNTIFSKFYHYKLTLESIC